MLKFIFISEQMLVIIICLCKALGLEMISYEEIPECLVTLQDRHCLLVCGFDEIGPEVDVSAQLYFLTALAYST